MHDRHAQLRPIGPGTSRQMRKACAARGERDDRGRNPPDLPTHVAPMATVLFLVVVAVRTAEHRLLGRYQQAQPVAFDHRDMIRLTRREVVGSGVLGMHRVNRHHQPGQVMKQCAEDLSAMNIVPSGLSLLPTAISPKTRASNGIHSAHPRFHEPYP